VRRRRSSEAAQQQEPFELLELLGTGGFAHTYKARVLAESHLDEWGDTVAVKIPLTREKERALIQDLITAGSVHASLLAVGRSAANMVEYLGFEQYDGSWVMVLEYVSGGNLRHRIGKLDCQQPMDINDACDIAEGVLDGLRVLHAAHIVHRDIKPENILMDGGVPKITDFGISRALASNEQASSTTGTLPYMSPEILAAAASFNTDLWALSVTLYEMLAGCLPFGGSSVVGMPQKQLIDQICEGVPTPIPDICSDVRHSLWEVVARGMEKDPKTRYQTAAEMKEALRQCRADTKGTDDEFGRRVSEIHELLASPGGIEAAEKHLDALVRDHPKDGRSYLQLGEFYARCDRVPEAVDAFKKGLAWDQSCALLYWNLALVYHKLGRRRAARSALVRATELGLESGLVRYAEILLRALQE